MRIIVAHRPLAISLLHAMIVVCHQHLTVNHPQIGLHLTDFVRDAMNESVVDAEDTNGVGQHNTI